MKLFLSFISLFCLAVVQAQSCTKISFQTVSSISGSTFSETVSELTVCGDKTVLISEIAGMPTKLITNADTGISLLLTDYGVDNKMAVSLSTTFDSAGKITEEDFHFTGKRKTILSYNCEEFTIEKENGVKATGYLARELPLQGNESQSMLTFSRLGTVMECTIELGFGMTSATNVTKVETVSIENPKEYFSTEVPEGYKFIDANSSVKEE